MHTVHTVHTGMQNSKCAHVLIFYVKGGLMCTLDNLLSKYILFMFTPTSIQKSFFEDVARSMDEDEQGVIMPLIRSLIGHVSIHAFDCKLHVNVGSIDV